MRSDRAGQSLGDTMTSIQAPTKFVQQTPAGFRALRANVTRLNFFYGANQALKEVTLPIVDGGSDTSLYYRPVRLNGHE
jgi:hypothetical protein